MLDVRRNSLEIYKRNAKYDWLLSFTFIIIACAMVLLDLLVSSLSLFLVPLIILPFLFATFQSHIMFDTSEDRLTLGTHFRFFAFYFQPGFNSCFRFFASLAKSFGFYFILTMIFSGIALSTFKNNQNFIDFYNALMDLIDSGGESVALINLLNENMELLIQVSAIAVFPPVFISCGIFIYYLSLNSINVFYKTDAHNVHPQFQKLIVKQFFLRNFPYRKDYFALNWPLLVLFFVGVPIGCYLGYVSTHTLSTMFTLGGVFGILFMLFYFPFFLCNTDALYRKYKPMFLKAKEEAGHNLFTQLQNQIMQNEQIKKEYEKMMADKTKNEEDKVVDNKDDNSSKE